jgi:hypothetical protein
MLRQGRRQLFLPAHELRAVEATDHVAQGSPHGIIRKHGVGTGIGSHDSIQRPEVLLRHLTDAMARFALMEAVRVCRVGGYVAILDSASRRR